jgi:hypothetical protein
MTVLQKYLANTPFNIWARKKITARLSQISEEWEQYCPERVVDSNAMTNMPQLLKCRTQSSYSPNAVL